MSNDWKLAKNQCKTCPFRKDGRGIKLSPDRLATIKCYLIEGQNHFCHCDRTNKTLCRGGRLYQLEIWSDFGRIDSPTHEALDKAMRDLGVTPSQHITDNIGNP